MGRGGEEHKKYLIPNKISWWFKRVFMNGCDGVWLEGGQPGPGIEDP